MLVVAAAVQYQREVPVGTSLLPLEGNDEMMSMLANGVSGTAPEDHTG